MRPHLIGAVRAISEIPLAAIGDPFGFSSSEREISERMFKRSIPGGEFMAPSTITISERVNVVFELQ